LVALVSEKEADPSAAQNAIRVEDDKDAIIRCAGLVIPIYHEQISIE
jgi:hypothetical protein